MEKSACLEDEVVVRFFVQDGQLAFDILVIKSQRKKVAIEIKKRMLYRFENNWGTYFNVPHPRNILKRPRVPVDFKVIWKKRANSNS